MADETEKRERIIAKGLEGVVVDETEMSFIDGLEGKLIYRGYNIQDLAENCCFEEIAYLFWEGQLPTRPELDEIRRDFRLNHELPEPVMDLLVSCCDEGGREGATPMAILRTAVSALALFDPDAQDNSMEANRRKAVRLGAKIPTVVAAWGRLSEGKDPVPPDPELDHAANFLYMLHGQRPTETEAQALDTYLILLADHGFNASTFTGRVTVSTLSDMHSAIAGAIGTLKGPLHGGAPQRVMAMFRDIGSPQKAESYVEDLLDRGERVMGFGHRVYKVADPRANQLRRMSKALAEESGNPLWHEIAIAVEDAATDRLADKGICPNVEFYTATVHHYIGIPAPLSPMMFACGRVVGWTAHVMEQYADNRLIRPRAQYVGSKGLKFVPIDKR